MKNVLSIHPEEVSVSLLRVLPKRTKDILEQRFGLGRGGKRMTLDAIGKKYGVTRERIRQVEADGLSRITKSQAMGELSGVFSALEDHFGQNGRVISETKVLSDLSANDKHNNHIYFLLSLHKAFSRVNENDELHTRWHSDKSADDSARNVLKRTVDELRRGGEPVGENKLFDILSASANAVTDGSVARGVLANWLGLSKVISEGYFGEWGLTEFPAIKPRGVRDLSHIVLAKHGKPMHFSEVSSAIGKLVGSPVHMQTVHNELIKDLRFVLVGRGLYALQNWGYEQGTVKDIVSNLLRSKGAVSKDKIISFVSKQRFVKPNTIAINLDNSKYFKKLADGRYSLR
jgi:hypothetical protein